MASPQLIARVRNAIRNYPGDQYLYLHRSIAIARCLGWEFTDRHLKAEFQFERLVVGNEWPCQGWGFGVAWDSFVLSNFDRGRLSAGQLRDAVVLDPEIFRMASAVHPDSDGPTIRLLKERLGLL